MSSQTSAIQSTAWKVAKLHGALMIVAGFLGVLSLDLADGQFNYNLLAAAYAFLFISGVSCFFIKKKRVIAVSILALFVTIYTVSFWVTNEYYLPIGSFIIYVDLIMISTIFFGEKVGLYAMVGVFIALTVWLALVDYGVVNPTVSEPNAENNALFNCFLFGYFFFVAALFKGSITQQTKQVSLSEIELSEANKQRNNRITSLKNRIGQIYELHETHIIAIRLYFDKFSSNNFDSYTAMKDELKDFLSFIDREIIKINSLLSSQNERVESRQMSKNSIPFIPTNKIYRTFYKITVFYSTWMFILHAKNIDWFSALIILNIALSLYLLVKKSDNTLIFTIILNLNISILFIALFVFTDMYGGAPVLFAISIYLALASVYVFGFKKSIPLLLLFSFLPYLRIKGIELGIINPLFEINVVGVDLFLNLFPIMIFTYLLTKTYLDDAIEHFLRLQETNDKLHYLAILDKEEERKLEAILDGISDLSNYNSHQFRAPIARLSGIINLFLTLENDLEEFERSTGYNLPTLVQHSLKEFDIAFSEFDARINGYKNLEGIAV